MCCMATAIMESIHTRSRAVHGPQEGGRSPKDVPSRPDSGNMPPEHRTTALDRPTHDQPQSPLFALPSELRDLILRFTLTKGSPICPQRTSHRSEESTAVLPLFRTCRRIYSEAAKIYLGSNTFRFFDDGELDEIEMPLFFSSLGSDRLRLCTSVRLEASLGPHHQGQGRMCGRRYCVGCVGVDLSTMVARTSGRTHCCEVLAKELEIARTRVQAVLDACGRRGVQGLDVGARAALGREVGQQFCGVFEHLHPDYGD